jgi:fucose permease
MAGRERLQTQRWATSGCFLLTGLVFATWAARIPARKADLGLSDSQLALAFAGLNAGALLGLQLGAIVVVRLGSRRALAVGLPTFAGLLLPLALAPNLATLTLGLGVSAVANSVVDVAINDQGVAVQRRVGRSLLSGMHAQHSLGGVLGGALATLAAGAGITVTVHFTVVAVAGAGLALLAVSGLVRRTDPDEAEAAGSPRSLLSGWTGRLLLLGTLAFVFTLAEGSALDWAGVLLRDHRSASAAVAAAGLAVFQAAVTVGRLAGDRLIDRFGRALVFRAGALLGGLGLAAGLLASTAVGALVGLALLGLGLSALLPIAISAAGDSGTGPGSVPAAVARVSALGYLGSFTGPLLIGALAHQAGLATALLLPAFAVAATTLAASVVRERQRA